MFLTHMVPAGPTGDPPQDTAEPISQVHGASVKTHLTNDDKDWRKIRLRAGVR